MPKFTSKAQQTEARAFEFEQQKISLSVSNMIRGLVVFALLGVAFASLTADVYVENLIVNSLPYALRSLGLYPAPLPSFNVSLGYQGVYRSMAKASFINGNATGFANLKRKFQCQGPRMLYGELTINCTLSLYPVTTSYGVQFVNDSRVYNIGSTGRLSETVVEVVIAGRSPKYIGSIKKLEVQKLGLITLFYSGVPDPFIKYGKVLEDAYRANVSTYLLNIIQQDLVNALNRAMADKPMQ